MIDKNQDVYNNTGGAVGRHHLNVNEIHDTSNDDDKHDKPLFTRRQLNDMPEEFRIEVIAVDGMWWSVEKWAKEAKVTPEKLQEYIDKWLAEGKLVQANYGACSYRMPLRAIIQWHQENNIVLGSQLTSFLYPPRIWAGRTEVDGFEEAPLREVATVSFKCSKAVAQKIADRLRGVARVRELHSGKYRAIGLSSKYILKIVKEELEHEEKDLQPKAHPRSHAKRRELVDFPPSFVEGLLLFYYSYTKSALSRHMETIKIFLPEEEERDAQIYDWIITAIEKYNEKSAVPFSGYLHNVVPRWTFDLPAIHLGKELSAFQKKRNDALSALRKKRGQEVIFSAKDIADEMGISYDDFDRLENQHKTWISVKTSTTLHWNENSSEERESLGLFTAEDSKPFDTELASVITYAILDAARATGDYASAYTVIRGISDDDVDNDSMGDLPNDFKEAMLQSMKEARSVL